MPIKHLTILIFIMVAHILYKDIDDIYEVTTFYTFNYHGEINTKENHLVKWLPIYELTKSKKWNKYNSIIFNKFLELKI